MSQFVYIPESEIWTDKVRMIQTKDPVLGGKDGPANWAPQDLTNRTIFLKKAVETAQASANAASTAASNADTKAGTAQTTANQAKTAAANAQKTADDAKSAAATADGKAVAAQTSANAANTAAKNADTKAGTAQTTANQAKTAAANAQTTADDAKSAAATADGKAVAAQKTADGKMSPGDFGIGQASNLDKIDIDNVENFPSGYSSFYLINAINRPINGDGISETCFIGPSKSYGFQRYTTNGNRTLFRSRQNNAWLNWIEIETSSTAPISTLHFFDTKTVPAGFIELAGQPISQAVYPKAYAEYGPTLPNRRDRYFRAAGGTRAGVSGTLQDDAIVNITGRLTSRPSDASTSNGAITNAIGAFLLENNKGGMTRPLGLLASSSDLAADYVSFDASKSGVRTANEVRPYSVSVLVCIKAQ